MIQHTNPRGHGQTAISPYKQQAPASVAAGTPNTWGRWANNKHYSLEVVQQPLRARMCGFGDKDRRPIAPAAVAKMVVKRQDDTPVDVDDIDCSFFLVTVDLWSADGTQEMNLVLHPSSSDRYIPTHLSKPRRPRGSMSGSTSSTPAPQQASPVASYNPYQMQDYSANSYARPPAPTSAPTWGYSTAPTYSQPSPHHVLPSISSFNRGVAASSTNNAMSWNPESSDSTSWGASVATSAPYADGSFPTLDPILRTSSPAASSSTQDAWPASSSDHTRYPQEALDFASLLSTPGPYPQYSPPAPVPPPSHTSSALNPTHQPQQNVPLPRHTYTRTLVGPLSANACPLKDEHRRSGIFFLFQDLSVRTEGTFRLRLRLMNVGAPPAPEAGAVGIHTGVSPVLAQTFTEPFTVFSAKRFPGVPDTTALSIALGNQGQKIPLRNRHGSGKTGGRRRRGGSDSDDDSS